MAIPILTWLDDYFGPAIVRLGGFFFPKRPVLEFQPGPGVDIEIEDDDTKRATVVAISAIGGVPGGAVGEMQYHALDGSEPIFAGTPKLTVVAGEVVHSGKPVHKEDQADFRYGTEDSLARSQWRARTTLNATETPIVAISVPAAEHGDCRITVIAELTCNFAGGGGPRSLRAWFKRVSGTLTRIDIEDVSATGAWEGTALGGVDIEGSGNDTINLNGTGIAATDIAWIASLHIQVAVLP